MTAFATLHRDAGLLLEQGQHHVPELGREMLRCHRERHRSLTLTR